MYQELNIVQKSVIDRYLLFIIACIDCIDIRPAFDIF